MGLFSLAYFDSWWNTWECDWRVLIECLFKNEGWLDVRYLYLVLDLLLRIGLIYLGYVSFFVSIYFTVSFLRYLLFSYFRFVPYFVSYQTPMISSVSPILFQEFKFGASSVYFFLHHQVTFTCCSRSFIFTFLPENGWPAKAGKRYLIV